MINITSISWHWPVSEARHTLTYHKVSEARHTLMYHKWISDIEPVSWFSWIFNSTSVWASSTLANYTLGGNDWKPLSCLFRGFNSFSSWLTFSITLTSSECSIVESFPPSLLSNFSMSLWYWILFFMGEYSSECPSRGGSIISFFWQIQKNKDFLAILFLIFLGIFQLFHLFFGWFQVGGKNDFS